MVDTQEFLNSPENQEILASTFAIPNYMDDPLNLEKNLAVS